MGAVRFELLLEFGIILLAPLLHQLWLWKTGSTGHAGLRRSAMIFGPLYALILLALLMQGLR